MKYDLATTKKLVEQHALGVPTEELALQLGVPTRSVIAKLSSMGLYKRKEYTDKRGLPPIKKEVYVENIAKVLDVDLEILESLEKVNKNVLKLLLDALSAET